MTIAAGEKLPDATFKTITPDGAKDLTTADIFASKKVVFTICCGSPKSSGSDASGCAES